MLVGWGLDDEEERDLSLVLRRRLDIPAKDGDANECLC